MKEHSYLEHTFKVQVPSHTRELIGSAIKEADDAGVPEHAKMQLVTRDISSLNYVYFTWTDEWVGVESG